MRWLIFSIVLGSGFNGVCHSTAFAEDEDWRVQRLDERYDDFFAHRRQDRIFDKQREAGAAEVKKENEKWDLDMAIARKEFVKNRPPPPNLDAAYREWAAQQKTFDKEYAQAQKQYLRVKNHIEQLEEHAKKIPENLEYDLDNRYQ